ELTRLEVGPVEIVIAAAVRRPDEGAANLAAERENRRSLLARLIGTWRRRSVGRDEPRGEARRHRVIGEPEERQAARGGDDTGQREKRKPPAHVPITPRNGRNCAGCDSTKNGKSLPAQFLRTRLRLS